MSDPATHLQQIDHLIRRGRDLRAALAGDPGAAAPGDVRLWHRDAGALVTGLSGGSKAHWLSRAFSEAFLVRSTTGHAIEEVDATQILDRLIDVLERARSSVAHASGLVSAPSGTEATIRRFEFVHRRELRPILEQAYADGRRALGDGRFGVALLLACSVLEAIVTDALEHKGDLAACDPPAGAIADWPFEARAAVARRAGLIGGGCARLPAVAWTYRDLARADGTPRGDDTISERDARVAGQVLQVILRDLDPGR